MSDFLSQLNALQLPVYWLDGQGVFSQNEIAQQCPNDAAQAILEEYAGLSTADTAGYALPFKGLLVLPVTDGFIAFPAPEHSEAQKSLQNISAFLRDDLSNIFASLPMLARHLEAPETEYLHAIQRSGYKMLRALTNAETLYRLSSEAPRTQVIDLEALTKTLCTCVEELRRRGQPTVTFLGTGGQVLVEGDEQALTSAILNLVRNALVYTRDGNHVQVQLRTVGRQAMLTVRDSGIGILPQNQQLATRPFFSVDPYDDGEAEPGLGLGLALARLAAASMRGSLALESRFGEGSRFVLSLPLYTGSQPAVESRSAQYLLDRFSPVFVQMSGVCQDPEL